MILSNGNLHYFWDLERGNPYLITSFPTPESVVGFRQTTPNPDRIVAEIIERDYTVLTQRPTYKSEAGWLNEAERAEYVQTNKLRFMRPYQLDAVHVLQQAVKAGSDRFLFEMATGTGKTLTSAAVIKLFLRTGNARRVLFLVDRLELEDQAKKAFAELLSADYRTVIYKENRDDWRHAEIVVTTVQSLLFNNKYQRQFSPTDFDLVISDEAHRSIGGNARAVFDYFVGYKLGLTATPRDYLKHFDRNKPTTRDPRETERRLLLDTYRTFGCEDGQPTFRYSLLDGVKDGFLINPTVVDARTDVTTQLLSEEGFVATFDEGVGGELQESFGQREFEKRFFSDATNQLFCKTFLENGATRSDQPGDRQVDHICGQSEACGQVDPNPQRNGRPHVPGQVSIGFCGSGHIADCRCPAIHHQLHEQQTAGVSELPFCLQNQQGQGLRNRGDDDHRLRLPGSAQPRLVPPDLLAHRLHPDQGTWHPQAQFS